MSSKEVLEIEQENHPATQREREEQAKNRVDPVILKRTPGIPTTEFSPEFAQGMLSRMELSYVKYGAVAEAYPSKINAIESGLIRLGLYLGEEEFEKVLKSALEKFKADRVKKVAHRRKKGNKEYLMDAGNFMMIEFMCPANPDAYFEATDSDGSPGRVSNAGQVSETSNTVNRENIRRGGSNMRTDGGFYKREGD